jgi:hypothetical protein
MFSDPLPDSVFAILRTSGVERFWPGTPACSKGCLPADFAAATCTHLTRGQANSATEPILGFAGAAKIKKICTRAAAVPSLELRHLRCI